MKITSQSTCIYCHRQLSPPQFNREHVLSKAFGHFKNAPVLRCVCRDCNGYFANTLERRFTRDNFEALLRYQYGLKQATIDGPVKIHCVEITLPESGDWQGARLRLSWSDGGPIVELIPQVAFRNRATGAWKHITIDEIKQDNLSRNSDLDTSTIKIFVHSETQKEEILQLLAEQSITFKQLNDLRPPSSNIFKDGRILVEITFQINDGIRRCVAKYAFNYLAYVAGAEFVLRGDFNPVRRFIRHGEITSPPIVEEHFFPILFDDWQYLRQTDGHIITVNWRASENDIVGQVTLFNHITYKINLARHVCGLWHPIREGIHYNTRLLNLQKVQGFSTKLIR